MEGQEGFTMPWIIGIDEAGYGPNLGPLVMTSVACRVPEDLAAANLWEVLQSGVRRHPSEDDGRLLIEDSKLVYSTARGLLDLETGVIAALAAWSVGEPMTLGRFLGWLCPLHHLDLSLEPWYSGASLVPVTAIPSELVERTGRFASCCRDEQILWGPIRSVIFCPKRFNELIDYWGSKGAALAHG